MNSPRSFEHTLHLRDSAEMVGKLVQLDMVRRERHSSGQLSSNPFSSTSSIDSTGRTLSPTVSNAHRLSGTCTCIYNVHVYIMYIIHVDHRMYTCIEV